MHPERHRRNRHRFIALPSAALILWFAVSGMVLNHAGDLGLADRPLPAALVRALYAADLPDDLSGLYVQGQWITTIDGVLFVGTRQAGACSGGLRGAIALDDLFVVACDDALQVTDPNGAPAERIDAAWGLAGTITGLGIDRQENRVLVATTAGNACLDIALTALTPCTATPGTSWTQRLPDDARGALATALGEQRVDLERLVHDLHSGRLFGAAARWVWDLFALALIALAASGIAMLRRRR